MTNDYYFYYFYYSTTTTTTTTTVSYRETLSLEVIADDFLDVNKTNKRNYSYYLRLILLRSYSDNLNFQLAHWGVTVKDITLQNETNKENECNTSSLTYFKISYWWFLLSKGYPDSRKAEKDARVKNDEIRKKVYEQNW